MGLNFSYIKKFSASICFLLILYTGIATIIFFDVVYSVTPLDIIRNQIEREQIIIHDSSIPIISQF